MHTRYFVLLMGILLVACSAAAESPPTAQPESASSPEPTAIPTEVVETEIPPSPSPTKPPPATPTQKPTATPNPIQVDFTWHENNPILINGAADEWDYWRVWDSKVVLIDDVFHMFYTGTANETIGIGYAVSTDGLTYTKYDTNPILQPDGEGFDAVGVGNATPLVVGDTWMLYYNASVNGERLSWDLGGGSSIGLTTAPEPTGPWTPGQLVLKAGIRGEWDSGFILPTTVFSTEDGYRMYYAGGPDPEDNERMCGMATSPDGINWKKYDDPSTTEPPFAKSDPVMQPSSTGGDSDGVHCSVLKTDSGWEMFYEGWGQGGRIFYATSPDGIQWSKYSGSPILKEFRTFPTVIKVGSTYYLYSHNYSEADQYVATGTINQP